MPAKTKTKFRIRSISTKHKNTDQNGDPFCFIMLKILTEKLCKLKFLSFTLYFKVLTMHAQNQQSDTLQDVKDIKRLMERSSRFISLSGLSGVSAGFFALAGAGIARFVLFKDYYSHYNDRGFFADTDFRELKTELLGLAAAVFAAAFLSAFYFTWWKSANQGVSLWNYTSRRLFWNMLLPLAPGALFILVILRH